MRAEDLGRRLQEMLGPGAGVGWSEVGDPEGLFPAEAEAMARAVPARRAEFAAGRRAARAALATLGLPEAEIPVGPHRVPVWPEDISGAITHDRGVALAAVMPSGEGAIGIDLTEAAPLPDDTRSTILPQPEEAGLIGLEARMAFSAKESLFKALFPGLETFFGFEAAVFLPRPDGRFTLRLAARLGPFEAGRVWQGARAVLGDDLLTAVPAPDGSTRAARRRLSAVALAGPSGLGGED